MADLFSATPSYENNIGKHPLEPIRASSLLSRQRKSSSWCSLSLCGSRLLCFLRHPPLRECRLCGYQRLAALGLSCRQVHRHCADLPQRCVMRSSDRLSVKARCQKTERFMATGTTHTHCQAWIPATGTPPSQSSQSMESDKSAATSLSGLCRAAGGW